MSDQPSGSSEKSPQDVKSSDNSKLKDTSIPGSGETEDSNTESCNPSHSRALDSSGGTCEEQKHFSRTTRKDSGALETSTEDLYKPFSSSQSTSSVTKPQHSSSVASIPSGNIDPNLAMVYNELFNRNVDKMLAKQYKSYPTPILYHDLLDRHTYHKIFGRTPTNWAILALQVENFTSYAAHFCRSEVRGGREIVSIGCGDGSIEREIIRSYRGHFGDEAGELKITLVDPHPMYPVDFTYVHHLMAARPSVVRNCSILIIWPQFMSRNCGYDIDAVRKLQPRAALVLYEPNEVSGSGELTAYLRRQTEERVGDEDGWWRRTYRKTNFGLSNYKVELVATQEVFLRAGEKSLTDEDCVSPRGMRAYSIRMVKLIRQD